MEEAREKEEGGKFALDLLTLYADTVDATPIRRRVSVQRIFIYLLFYWTKGKVHVHLSAMSN